jgi:predicted RNA-binding Zn-ribbon protein involved in translation (DUF1610 family)
VSRAIGDRLDRLRDSPSPTRQPKHASPRARVTDREVPLPAFILVCPACGASLGTAADVAHFVGSCPSCSRRIASRRRGSRVGLEQRGT